MTRCSICAFSPVGFSLFCVASWTQVELVYLSMIFWASMSAIGYCCCGCCAWGALETSHKAGTRTSTAYRFRMEPPFRFSTRCTEGIRSLRCPGCQGHARSGGELHVKSPSRNVREASGCREAVLDGEADEL